MVKRSAKQVAASRRNLEKARARKSKMAKLKGGVPHGKMLRLYRGTRQRGEAERLITGQGIKTNPLAGGGPYSWFTTDKAKAREYGLKTVSIKIPTRKASFAGEESNWIVQHKDLIGIKATREHRAKSRVSELKGRKIRRKR